MKNGKIFKYSLFFILYFTISLLFCSNYKSRFSAKEIRKMESQALAGNFDAAMTLSDYYGVDLQDVVTQEFWNCICFENNPIKGSWNFVHVNYMEDGKSKRYQYLIFLCEQYKRTNAFRIKQYEELHKKFADFNFSNDNLEYLDVTNENYQYFHDKAFSGSGLAALKIAQFYENQNAQNIYSDCKRLLDIGCKYNPEEEKLPLFWYRIGAQNGNKECMRKYAEILKRGDDKYDRLRAKFWEENKQNCIVFWDYNPELSIDYLSNHDFIECKRKFPNYIKIDFSEIQEFNKESQVFILKEEFNTLKLGNQYKNSKDGKLFVSIIIDNKIVLNGVNGSVFVLLLPTDELPKVEDYKYIIDMANKKNIIITDRLSTDIFKKRYTIDNDLKELISKNISLQK